MSLYANSLHLMAANVLNAGFGFLFWMVAARMYPAQAVGLTAAVISAVGLLAMLSLLGLDYAMIRFLPGAADPEGIINSSLTIGIAMAVAASLVFLFGLGLWSPALLPVRQSPPLAAAFVAAAALTAASALLASVYISRKQTSMVLAHATVFGAGKVMLAAALAAVSSTAGLLGAWALGLLAAVACGLVWFLPRVEEGHYRPRPTLRRAVLNDMTHFASANYIAAALWGAPMLLLPLLIVNLVGPEANAYFYVAASVAGLVAMIPHAVSLSLFAHGSNDEGQLFRHTLGSARFTLGLLVPAIAGVLLLGDKILLLFGRAYSEQATGLLWILALATVPMTANFLFFSVRRVQQKMAGVVGSTLCILVVTMGLSVLLLPRMGLLGAGLAWLAAQSSVALVLLARLALNRRLM